MDHIIWTKLQKSKIYVNKSKKVGANDVANPFGTSVGSGALTLLQVCICATFMETLGAMTLGGAVSGTIGKGLVNSTLYEDQIPQFMIGQSCAMVRFKLYSYGI